MKQKLLKMMLLLCALVVGSSAWADDYELYSGDITEGDYIVYYDGKAMNTTVDASRLQYETVTPSNDVITTDDATIVWHIAASGDYWTLYNADANAYAAGTGAKNKAQMLADGTDDKALWTVSGDETYEFVNKANAAANVNKNLRNNGTYGFACYATGTGGALSLYKKKAAAAKTDPTITFNDGTVRVGKTLDLSNLFTSNSTGVVTYSITAGDSYASIDGSILTGAAEGSVTVKAEQATAGSYNAGEASATITVDAALALSSIAITTPPTKTTYTEGETFDPTGMVVTATYSDSSTGDVTASCTFSPSTALTTSNTEITVSYTENAVEKTTTQTITVNAIPTYTAHFSINGSIDEGDDCTVAEGEDIVFPSDPAANSGKSFVGWVTEAIDGTTNDKPSFVTSETMGNSDITYYAVFADVTSGTEISTTKTITTSTENIPTSYGTAKTFTEYTFEGIKFMVQQMYLNAGKLQWRAAGNNNGTGTMYNTDALNKIQSVVLTYADGDNNKNFTLAVGDSENPTSGTSIEPTISQGNQNVYAYDCSSYNKSYFVLTNGSGAGYLTSIAITYLAGTPATYSDYCTTVIAAAVEKPVITVAKNPFQISTTATITCGTAGAAIKYSFDGETWNDYSEDLTITTATTLYAKAVKNEDESTVASVEIIKNLVETAVIIYDTEITNDAFNISTEAGSLSAIVATYNAAEDKYEEIDGATVTWSGNNDAVATIVPSTGVVTLTGIGEVTFTATYAGDGDYKGSTDIYTLTVVNRSDVTLPAADQYGTYTMDVENPVTNGEEVTLTYTPATGYENYQATWSVNGTPISGNKFEMPAEAVTVTVSVEEIKDYATLPFNWEGGSSSDLKALIGVTVSGNGNDYASSSSPYLVKLDGTGDYILIKTDSQPGKVTIGVKMIGGSETSQIQVQESADGNTFNDVQSLEISGDQGDELDLESSNAFAASTRYVKLYFEKGSNVGVGPIAISKATSDPVINASNVELACDATSGEIAYTISNPVQGVSLSAISNDSWITNVTVDAENSKVTFETTANIGNERSGSITLSYTGADNRVVTVTQARYIVNATYTLITSVDDITPGKHYVIANSKDDGSAKVMGEQKNNNRDAVSGATIATIENEKVLTVSNEYEFVFYGPDANGSYTICDANTNGYLYAAGSGSNNYLRTQPTNDSNGKWYISIDSNGAATLVAQGNNSNHNMRFNTSNFFSCYSDNTTVNALVYLYEKKDDTPVATTASVKLNDDGYATFASTSALDFLDADVAGYSAWQITGINGNEINFTQIENHVEAGTGILLQGTANTTVKLNILPDGGYKLSDNKLVGITTPTAVENNQYYGLKGNEFKKVNEGTVPAGKALLPVSAVTGNVKSFTFVFNGTDGIQRVEKVSAEAAEGIFNLAGQRVSGAQKGIFIVNGKKVVK